MNRTKVWDLPVRVFHLGLALAVGAALLTGEEDDSARLHAQLGLAVLGLVVFRVVFGSIGSPHARFSAFVRRPAEVFRYARAYLSGRPPPQLGHNPIGGVMVLLLLGTLGLTAGTGVLIKLGPEWAGPLSAWISSSNAHGLKELHELAAGSLLFLIPLHVAGVLLTSRLESQNLIGSMITGWKKSTEAEPVRLERSFGRRSLGFLAAAAAGVAVALALAALLPNGSAEAAETPRSMLESYRSEAGNGFDAARGQRLYLGVHTREGKSASCASCHTEDPTHSGRSPAGKRIEPLAPSANPARFTDRRTTEKWFDRNCKQVLGRPCTVLEKGDLLTWLTSR